MTSDRAFKVIATVLAAGSSRRMGEINKLLAPWQGQPLLTHVLDAALGCEGHCEVVVVTGHQADQVAAVVQGRAETAHNPHYATGMASSLRKAIAWSQRHDPDGLLVLLGDMPLVKPSHIDRMLTVFAETGPRAIIQATNAGKPGNPVLLPKALFDEVMQIEGDRGARAIIEAHDDMVVPVEIGTAASRDFDTPEAFAKPEV